MTKTKCYYIIKCPKCDEDIGKKYHEIIDDAKIYSTIDVSCNCGYIIGLSKKRKMIKVYYEN